MNMMPYENEFFEWPTDESFDEVGEGLFVGGAVPEGDRVAQQGFDCLVLCAVEYQCESKRIPGVDLLHCPFYDDDSVMSLATVHLIVMTAKAIALYLKAGKKVLVTCAAGINRSALVAALTLQLHENLEPWVAVERIRARRHPRCLCNEAFERAALRRNELVDELMPERKT